MPHSSRVHSVPFLVVLCGSLLLAGCVRSPLFDSAVDMVTGKSDTSPEKTGGSSSGGSGDDGDNSGGGEAGDQAGEMYSADLTVNYGNDLIHTGAELTFTSPLSGVDFHVGTSADTDAVAPDSWSTGDSYTVSGTGVIKVFGKITKAAMDDVVVAQVYEVVNDYPPRFTEPGSMAYDKDSPSFTSWAASHSGYSPTNSLDYCDVDPGWQDADNALGPATGNHFDIVSLGNGGQITLYFANGITDGDGYDFAVFENAFVSAGDGGIFAELAFIEVSSNGTDFVRFDCVSRTATQVGDYGTIDEKDVYGVAGMNRNNTYGDGSADHGTPFDLSWLKHKKEVINGTVNIDDIRYVRIIDIPGCDTNGNGDHPEYGGLVEHDSFGNIIYDAFKTWGSGGFDLEAVGVINEVD